jgi:hypothetical protein
MEKSMRDTIDHRKCAENIVDGIIKITGADKKFKPMAVNTIVDVCTDYKGENKNARIVLGFLVMYSFACLREKYDTLNKVQVY